MQSSAFYCNKNLISKISNETVIEDYFPVTFEEKYVFLKKEISKSSIFNFKSPPIVFFSHPKPITLLS